MDIAVSEAKAQLTDLVHRAEAGEEIVLTRFGAPVARITPVRERLRGEALEAFIDEIQASAKKTMLPGPDAAHSADFLFDDETGLPA